MQNSAFHNIFSNQAQFHTTAPHPPKPKWQHFHLKNIETSPESPEEQCLVCSGSPTAPHRRSGQDLENTYISPSPYVPSPLSRMKTRFGLLPSEERGNEIRKAAVQHVFAYILSNLSVWDKGLLSCLKPLNLTQKRPLWLGHITLNVSSAAMCWWA